ncbi:MAG TPA: serine/threonine-protein kinase [Thermoanaerobaculia bacterium]
MAFHCIRCNAEIDRSFKACPHCGEPVTEFLRRYLEEPIDGKYRIVERLGAGGMGEVYKVEHTFLGVTRVVKVIRPQISDTEDAHERFLREARLATKVQHPNVATLHDFSALPDGSHYMVWEFIDGENLAQLIRRRGVLPPRYALRLAIQTLNGLEAIHRAGIVHRDISPENLMITRDDQGNERVKIIDLGVAKAEEGEYVATRTGIFVGKLRYSSPEHLGFVPEGERIDGRADLYSVAIVLYEMLTGRPPFESTSPHQYILHHSREAQAPALDLTKVPGGAELQEVLARALERDRTKRWATARDFAAALERVEKTLPETLPTATPERDGEPTLRVTPAPVRSTVRTDIAQQPPARTVVDRAPAPPPAGRDNSRAIIVVLAILLTVVAAFALWQFRSRPAPQSAAVVPTATQTAAPQRASPLASTSVDVVSTTTTTTAEPPRAAALHKTSPKPMPVVVPPPEPAQSGQVHTYTEGGSSASNEEAISYLQAALRGVSRVAVEGGGDADQTKIVSDLLRKRGLTVADGSDVTLRFNGTVKRLGFGRKRRAADATISKGGRVIFRYQLPTEDYRVGDNPAEAFARVIGDAFGH